MIYDDVRDIAFYFVTVESDACQTWGVCSQQCLAVGLGHQYRCACNDGYVIDKDGYSCKPDGQLLICIIFTYEFFFVSHLQGKLELAGAVHVHDLFNFLCFKH